MATLAERARQILEPYVGAMVADTCVRATALSLGKSSDALNPGDMDALATSIKRLLGPVAPLATIDILLSELRRSVGP